MKQTLIFLLLFTVAFTGAAQPKKRGKVKRKYRDVEYSAQQLPQVVFRGLVRDAAGNPVAGAGVEVEGLRKLVHSNESGQFMLSDLPTGIQRLRVSSLGFQTKTIDYMLHVGNNDHYISLERGRVPLDKAVSVAQKREQQLSDIPAAIDVIVPSIPENPGGTDFRNMSLTIPGVDVEKTGAGNPAISIHGTSGQSGFPELSPPVALFSDQAPVSRSNGLPSRYFDMERIEVVKGPQNVLFGRNALNGAVHLISKKPEDKFGGFVRGGGGSYWSKEIEAAVNLPVVEDMLFVRASGIYHDRKGYIKNTEGGTLNGENLAGGRFSVRFMPAWNHKMDLQLNYQRSNAPGMAFIHRDAPGESALFGGSAALNRGKELGTEAVWMDASLTYQLFRDEHNSWTSVTTFRKNSTDSRRDADGTLLPALDMDNESGSRLFFQEVRYNFVRRSHTNGSIGANFLLEKENSTLSLSSNDALIADLQSGLYNFIPFPEEFSGSTHHEKLAGSRKTQSAQAFMHVSHQWTRRLFFTLGARTVFDWLSYAQESVFSGGESSTAAENLGVSPNFMYKPAPLQEVTKNSLSFTAQAGITYRLKENFNFYLNAVRGRRPQVLQFTWNSAPLVTGAERVYGAESGWKTIVKKRIFWDVNGFCRKHFNVHTLQHERIQNTALLTANGKATSFGGETSLKIAIVRALDLFGSYARMHSVFDSTGVDGSNYRYAGNHFARMPENSFSAGFSTKFTIAHRVKFFATPWYSWKSHYWLTEANTPGLEQPAFGLLNINLGIEMSEPKLSLTVRGTNLLNENYLSGTGYPGGLPVFPMVVPGQPRMVEAGIMWRF